MFEYRYENLNEISMALKAPLELFFMRMQCNIAALPAHEKFYTCPMSLFIFPWDKIHAMEQKFCPRKIDLNLFCGTKIL